MPGVEVAAKHHDLVGKARIAAGQFRDNVDASDDLGDLGVELQLELHRALTLDEPGDAAVVLACEHERRRRQVGIRNLPVRSGKIEAARVGRCDDPEDSGLAMSTAATPSSLKNAIMARVSSPWRRDRSAPA